eukprot:gene3307-3792_t
MQTSTCNNTSVFLQAACLSTMQQQTLLNTTALPKPPREVNFELWQATILIINCITAISLNVVIFYLFKRHPSLQTAFNATILNACFADILVSINMLLSTAGAFFSPQKFASSKSNALCHITGFINLLCFVASVMSLAAVSINRYFLICKRHIYSNAFTRLGTSLYIAFVWVFSVLLSFPPLVGWSRFTFDEGKLICFADWKSSVSYMVFMIAMCFGGPIAATLLSLFFILRMKRKVSNNVIELNGDWEDSNDRERNRLNQQRMKNDREERKITLSIVAVVAVFFLAWGPFVVVMFVEVIGQYPIPAWVDFASLYFGCLNSTANPIIYLTLNGNFRIKLKKLIFKNTLEETSASVFFH